MTSRRSVAVQTAASMLFFAANSLLCRVALTRTSIDAATFTALRLASGALLLLLVVRWRRRRGMQSSLPPAMTTAGARAGSWSSALALFVYAAAFSLAYVRLQTGFGALLLFGTVQLSMTGWGVLRGERPSFLAWTGLALAFAGLVALTRPGAGAPDPGGAALMVLAGLAWGVYSLRGRGASDAISTTAGNFTRTLPCALLLWGLLAGYTRTPPLDGVLLATLSGAVTSALGYVVWYGAVKQLLATEASVVQLSVPVLAAGFGIGCLGETLSARLLIAGTATLSGVALAVVARERRLSVPANPGRDDGHAAQRLGRHAHDVGGK